LYAGKSSWYSAFLLIHTKHENLQTNLYGPFVLTQKAIPYLEKTHGHILFNSSIGGSVPFPNAVDYNTSKAAMNMMAKIIAKEEGPK